MSKLREAAQFLLTAVEDEGVRGMDTALDALRDALREDALVCLSETHQQLGAELGETENVRLYVRDDEYEYDMWGELELIGTIKGTHGGRWMLAVFAENASAVWPDGTAVYVRRKK